ncbi:FixG Ig-like domain-containing protein [Teichococcus aestuarii]
MKARQPVRFSRPRTWMYAGVLGAVALVMLGAFLLRDTATLTVLRDRAPLYVRLSDGALRNAYTLKLANRRRGEAALALALDAPQGFRLVVQDSETDAAGRPLLALRPDGVTQWRALVTAPAGLRLAESTPVRFRLLDAEGRTVLSERSVFLGPK